ncbi:hypothetical protein SSS_10832 [Sarcoptes scabiei]|nr:hypothetical protein SSS_10832 [Sarcoptes scabiei]
MERNITAKLGDQVNDLNVDRCSLSQNQSYILKLSNQRIDFEPVSKNVSVFYDESNRQVFIVIDNGSEGIIVKNLDGCIIKFSIQDRGRIVSIKFSTDFEMLLIQRTRNTVEFFIFKNQQPFEVFAHKIKQGIIMGFFWTSSTEIIIVTDNGVEFYQINMEKKTLKLLKSFSLSVEWFVFQPKSNILLIANGTFSNVIHPFLFRLSNAYKLNKFEIDWNNLARTANISLQERDVTVTNLYDKPRMLILRYHPNSNDKFGVHILIYTFQRKDLQPQKTDILLTNLTGKFAINIVDNLVVVHHQTSKASLIFDINLPAHEIKGNVKYHQPIIPRCTIEPHKINSLIHYELYSLNWAIFQPNIIIDAKYGCLWFLELNFDPIEDLIRNVPILIDFLLLRKKSKSIILRVCRNVVPISGKFKQNPIGNFCLIFNKLNLALKKSKNPDNNLEKSSSKSIDNFDNLKQKHLVHIDQKDILSNFFEFFGEDKVSDNLGIAIVFEYINSLTHHEIPIDYCIYEFLINRLISTKNFYRMHQFLQYHVFTDSKHLACLLLSLNNTYAFAIQLGLDMLKRLQTSDDEIIDVLLSQNQIIRALRYVEKHRNIYSVSARKFLEASLATNDLKIFHQVFKFFQLRNLKLRNSADFVKGENCTYYEKYFENNFGTKYSFVT